MPFFVPEEDLPHRSFIPRRLLREEPWGEIWQVLHRDSSTTQMLVAYTTPEGDELYEEVAAGLARWKEVAGTMSCSHLLRILEINDSAIPYVLVEDPGGPSMREYVGSLKENMKAESLGRFGVHASKAILEAEAYDCGPVILSPDCIFVCPTDRDNPWKLLPVSPRAIKSAPLIAGGRYLPPEFRMVSRPGSIHPDIFSIVWLIIDAARRDYTSPFPPAISDVIPLKGFEYLLSNTSKMLQGAYSEPNVAAQGFERWMTKQLATDLANWEQAEKERKRGPFLNFFARNGKKIIGGTVAVVFFIGGAIGGFMLMQHMRQKKEDAKPLLMTSPADVATIYLKGAEKADLKGLMKVVSGGGAGPSEDLLVQLDRVRKHSPAQLTLAPPRMGGQGALRIVESDLVDGKGHVTAIVVFELREKASGEWYVDSAFFKPQG